MAPRSGLVGSRYWFDGARGTAVRAHVPLGTPVGTSVGLSPLILEPVAVCLLLTLLLEGEAGVSTNREVVDVGAAGVANVNA